MSIKCPTGIISIKKAIYGRTDRSLCDQANNDKTDCKSDQSEKVEKECNGKKECMIQVSNLSFGDPCGGTSKYLEVLFTCVLG